MRNLLTALITALIAAAVFVGTALGQTYPSKFVRIVIPFGPGGSADFLARLLADRLQAGLQQSVLVDYRPGGNYVIAADAVAKSPPDGYTLFMGMDAAMALNPLLYSKLPYDPERDFAPISHVASQPVFYVASSRAPVKSLPGLIAYAKANPGKLMYGTSSSLLMLTVEKIKLDSKIDMVNVPFKGSGAQLPSLINGEIDFAVTVVIPYATYVKQGKLFGLATSGSKREFMLPNTPTVRELGFPELEFSLWYALFAPAATPGAILEKLNIEVRKALSDPTTNERLVAAGLYPSASSAEQLRALVRSDIERWGKVIKATGTKLD